MAAKVEKPEPIRPVTASQDDGVRPGKLIVVPSRDGGQTVPVNRPVTDTGTVLKTKEFPRAVPTPSRDGSRPAVTGRNAGTEPKPSRDGQSQKSKSEEPSRDELEAFKKLLPPLPGGRWTVENEGYGWKVRRVKDLGKTTKTTRYFGIRWTTWRKLRGAYDDQRIRGILAEKVRDKERRLADVDTGPVQRANAG